MLTGVSRALASFPRFFRLIAVLLAGLFLMGFDRDKTEVIVQGCVAHGNGEEACRCAAKLQEKSLGPQFMEALYALATGDMTTYEMKLYEVSASHPNAMPRALSVLEARIKAECGPVR